MNGVPQTGRARLLFVFTTFASRLSLRSIDEAHLNLISSIRFSPADSVADRLKPMKTGDIFRDHPIAMKNYLGPLLVCAAALNFAVGCSNPYSAHPLSADQPVSSKAVPYGPKKTQIISEPPGARIEINDNYVGDAPITVELAQRGDYFDEDTVVRAIPTEEGDYTQTKRFLTNDPWYHPGFAGDKIPSRILFNMHLVATTPTTEVNVIPSN